MAAGLYVQLTGSYCFASAMFEWRRDGEAMARHWRSVGEDFHFGSENRKIFLKITTHTKRRLSLEAKVRKMQTLSLRGSMIAAMQSSF